MSAPPPPVADGVLPRLASDVVLCLAHQFLTDPEALAGGRSSWSTRRALKQYRIKEVPFETAMRLGGWSGPGEGGKGEQQERTEHAQPDRASQTSLSASASERESRRSTCRYAFGTRRHSTTVLVRFEDLSRDASHQSDREFIQKLCRLPTSFTRMHLHRGVLNVDPGVKPDPKTCFDGVNSLAAGFLNQLVRHWPKQLTSIVIDDLTHYRHPNFVAYLDELYHWVLPPHLTELFLPVKNPQLLFVHAEQVECPPALTRLQFDITQPDCPKEARHLTSLPPHIIDHPLNIPCPKKNSQAQARTGGGVPTRANLFAKAGALAVFRHPGASSFPQANRMQVLATHNRRMEARGERAERERRSSCGLVDHEGRDGQR
jgi:hypothetical protein